MKKNILAPAVALSLGLTGALGAAAPTFATGTDNQSQNSEQASVVTFEKTKLTVAEAKDGIKGTFKGKPGDMLDWTVYRDDYGPDHYDGAYATGSGPYTDEGGDPVISFLPLSWDPAGTYVFKYKINGEERDDITITVYEETPPPSEEDPEQPGDGEGEEPAPGEGEEPAPGEGDGTAPPAPGDEENPEQPGDGEGDGGGDTENPGDGDDTGEGEGDDQQPGEGDDAPAEDPALNLTEKKVKAADFVNKEKGLNAVVSNLEPGTEVKFNVAGTSGNAKNVRPFKQTVKADKDGNAVFSIKGISEDNPSAYLGKYTVTAEFDGQKLEDSFEVVSGKSNGKSDSEEPGSGGGSVSGGASDNVSDSGTLPRTGQGLEGLAAGVALLTVGGAAVLLTRRTRKA